LSSSSSVSLCNGTQYNPATQRCQSNVIETKCGTSWYNATNTSLRCESNVIETKCGTGWYNASTQFCYGTTVYSKCGSATYDPETQRCQSYVIETKCGTSWYNDKDANFRCQDNVIETKCGTDWYNTSTQFCYSTTVYSKCGDTVTYNPTKQFCDSRDGKAYKYVTIGMQTWMGENLNYNASTSKCYDNKTSNCTTYGRLYDWATAMALSASCNYSYCSSQISTKHKGICPAGWHIPSNAEWSTLETTVGGSSIAGTKLKATTGWFYPNGSTGNNGTDNYGFSALPGGYIRADTSYILGNHGYWWSTTESVDGAYCRIMDYYYANVTNHNEIVKAVLYSVRCVKD